MPHCKLPDCPFSKTGRCLEGRGTDCPNLLPGDTPAGATIEPEPAPVASSTVRLYSGNPLALKEAREFSGRGRATVVALVGLSECGKTSLLARLHQLFQEGPVGGYHFAGSRTMLRFEELNWKATVESGVTAPQMDRSSRIYDNSFLHFTVRSPDGDREYSDVLLNDISGETVRDAVKNQSLSEQLLGLARADHLVVVADGGALSDLEQCFDHAGRVSSFVQRIVQSGQIGRQTVMHLVISKKDEMKDGGEAVAMQLEADFRRLFADKVGGFYFWRIAARPCDGTHPTKAEIAKLFAKWATTSLRYPGADLTNLPAIDWARDFCRYGAPQPQGT